MTDDKHVDRYVRITNRERFLIVRALVTMEVACETMGHETSELRQMQYMFCEENWIRDRPIRHANKVKAIEEQDDERR